MIREEFRKKLEDRHKVLVILWGVFLVSVVLYLFVGNLSISRRRGAITPDAADVVRTVLWILAILDVLLLRGPWRNRLLGKEGLLAFWTKPQIPTAFQDAASATEARAVTVVSLYFTFKVAAFALSAAIAIYGLVVTFLTREMADQYLLSLISLVLLLLERPSREFIQELVREVEIRGEK